MDTIKVRIQAINEENSFLKAGEKKSTSPFVVGKNLFSQEGLGGLYKGLDAALLR